eukprot:Seg1308.5 transcript_id=Seg1308.5/GoldUCD/mRNA.D3Y31 product="Zinc finger protein 704" protein_id=Seg1308.5/GoldUCD/D3Y31
MKKKWPKLGPNARKALLYPGRSQTASPRCEQNRKGVPEDAKDIKAAALALTSLSLSPAVTTQSEGVQKQKFVFPPTPQDEGQDHEMEQLNMPVDEGYSENLQKLRTRSFETPKIRNQRTRAASLDMGITEPIREHKLERAESWDVEKYQPDSKAARVDRGNKAFKCMWRGCGRVLTSLHGIIRHVKMAHLGPKTDDNVEFYFNDLFIDNEASVSSDDSLLSSGYSDDDGLIESEDGSAARLRMSVKFEGASELPKNQSKEENNRKEERSLRPERSKKLANVKKEFVLREAKQLTAFQKQLVNVVKFTAWRIDKCGAHSVVGKKLVFDLGSDQNVGVKGQGKAGNNKKQYVVENFEKLEKGTLKNSKVLL